MAIVGGSATVSKALALHAGANKYTVLAHSGKACFMVVGSITASVSKGRVNKLSKYVRCLWLQGIFSQKADVIRSRVISVKLGSFAKISKVLRISLFTESFYVQQVVCNK